MAVTEATIGVQKLQQTTTVAVILEGKVVGRRLSEGYRWQHTLPNRQIEISIANIIFNN